MTRDSARSVMIRCTNCSWVFSPTPGTPPPWCPHCGADLKAEPADRPPQSAAQASAPPEPPRVPEIPPPAAEVNPEPAPFRPPVPFFQARRAPSWADQGCLYRVYVTGTDLLFIALGAGFVHGAQFAAVGGAIGGLVGAAVAWQKHKQMEQRLQVLNGADEAALRQLTDERTDSFRVAAADVHDIRIDPPSGWSRFLRQSQCAGLLKLTHAETGEITLELPTVEDVSAALAELPRLFGTALQVNVSWRSF
jgi:hypothetical protein